MGAVCRGDDHAVSPATTTSQCLEEVGVFISVDRKVVAVGRDDGKLDNIIHTRPCLAENALCPPPINHPHWMVQ